MSMPPQVSVVVPVFNREALLPRALDSVLAQTFDDFECVVVDNASTDDSAQVADAYAVRDSRVRVIRGESNVGPVRNWLRGTEASRGRLVKLLFSDDWMERGCLAAAVDLFERSPDLGFVYFRGEVEGQVTSGRRRPSGIESSFSFLWRSLVWHGDVPVSPTAAMFRRSHILEALRVRIASPRTFDFLGTGVGYDQGIYLLAAVRSRRVQHVADPCVYYGHHPTSITVEANAKSPGLLLRGYLLAQLVFLDRGLVGGWPLTSFLRGAVYAHLGKAYLRHAPGVRRIGDALARPRRLIRQSVRTLPQAVAEVIVGWKER